MEVLYLIIFFILGLFMGSFYTVVGSRLPNKEDFLKSRSHCDKCKHDLSLLDMVPIVSYVLLKGKCRYCHEKISNLSTLMEFFTGVLYALAFYIFGFSYDLFTALGIISMLIILSVSDISYYIIPDEILIFFLGFFTIINTLKNGIAYALVYLVSGLILFAFMYIIMIIGNLIFQKESLGGGDIKLMGVVGLVLNPFLGLVVIFFASFFALPFSLVFFYQKKKKLVPFGPFLLTSFMFVYFTRINMSMIIDFIRSI